MVGGLDLRAREPEAEEECTLLSSEKSGSVDPCLDCTRLCPVLCVVVMLSLTLTSPSLPPSPVSLFTGTFMRPFVGGLQKDNDPRALSILQSISISLAYKEQEHFEDPKNMNKEGICHVDVVSSGFAFFSFSPYHQGIQQRGKKAYLD